MFDDAAGTDVFRTCLRPRHYHDVTNGATVTDKIPEIRHLLKVVAPHAAARRAPEFVAIQYGQRSGGHAGET
jgi:hypothetical protein